MILYKYLQEQSNLYCLHCLRFDRKIILVTLDDLNCLYISPQSMHFYFAGSVCIKCAWKKNAHENQSFLIFCKIKDKDMLLRDFITDSGEKWFSLPTATSNRSHNKVTQINTPYQKIQGYDVMYVQCCNVKYS